MSADPNSAPVERRKPGRPSLGQRTATGLRLPADLHARLLAAAEERDVSANLLVTKAVTQYLDRLIPIEAFVCASPEVSGE